MATAADNLKQKRAIETRRNLLAVAARLFGQYPYDLITVDDIAKEAGVSKGCVYFHFGSKKEVFEEASSTAKGENPELARHILSLLKGRQGRNARILMEHALRFGKSKPKSHKS